MTRTIWCWCVAFSLAVMALSTGARSVDDVGHATQPGDVSFDRFHNYAQQVALLEKLTRDYPRLLKLETYGKSYQGRDLWMASVTNSATGAIEDKPAFWIDAAYDGGETFTTEIALYFLNYLLTRYGADADITEVLDTRGFYILPNANPDAGEQLYQKPAVGPKAGPFMGVSRNAWLKPVDDDKDGKVDEDPPEDLDGDGLILQMRVADPLGHYVTDERDARLLRTRKPWEKGQWRLVPTEGVDSDGDGEINEDWYGGYDTNRNAPSNWDPFLIMEEVAPYPVYLPEVKHFIDALLARPNTFAMLNLHTTGVFPGGTLWEVPNSRSPEDFPAYDMRVLFPTLAREYERLMRKAPHSKATAMSGFVGYGQRGRRLIGLMSDFGYINLGLPSWVQENNIREPDYDDDGQLTEFERLRWNDTELKEKVFVNWKRFEHPHLGAVEIGGWKRNNDAHGYAPAETIAWHAERILPWYLAVARMAPLLRVIKAEAKGLGNSLFLVEARVRNIGVLDTSLTEHALAVPINGPTTAKASIEGAGVDLVMGDQTVDLGHLKGNQPGMSGFLSGATRTGEERDVRWLVRAADQAKTVTVTVESSKAGKHGVVVRLGGGSQEEQK